MMDMRQEIAVFLGARKKALAFLESEAARAVKVLEDAGIKATACIDILDKREPTHFFIQVRLDIQ